MHSIFRWTSALLLALGMALNVHADDTAAQIRQHAGEHRLLILGEFHGTRETPLLVRELMEAYAADGTPVRLALELPTDENAALATYLVSSGTAKARAALRGTPYWSVRSRMHDGRRSKDMLDLIEAARALRTRGATCRYSVLIACYPPKRRVVGTRPGDGPRGPRARTGIAEQRTAAGADRQRTWHAYAAEDDCVPPMTALLNDLELYNVRIEARGGRVGAVPPLDVAKRASCRVMPGHRPGWIPVLTAATT